MTESDHCNKESSGHLHYIVTEDLSPLVRDWAESKGFVAPSPKWFGRNHQLLRSTLASLLNVNDQVVIIDSLPYHYILNTIHPYLNSLSGREIEFHSVVSIDNLYLPKNNLDVFPLQITRGIDIHGRDLGRVPRPHCLSIKKQIEEFNKERAGLNNDIVIVDDGIWTGGTLKMATDTLRENNFNIVRVVVGVHIKNRGKVVDLGIPVDRLFSVQTYEDDSRKVLDWVCERDFFPGISLGGRTVFDDELQSSFIPEDEKTIGAFYFEDKAWLKDWASIEDPNDSFAIFCLQRSVALFKEVERLSNKSVTIRDIDRIPLFIAQQRSNSSERVVDIFEKKIEILQK